MKRRERRLGRLSAGPRARVSLLTPTLSLLRSSPYLALLPVFVGVFIAADDQTVIVTVLPEIMFDLRVQINELDRASWTITGYLLGYVAAMPLMGRMSDVLGHRNMYVASMLVFMAGSVAAALTTSLTWLIAARVVQAIGAGALVPISIAIVGDLFEPEHRAMPLGLMGASAEAGGVIGPLWGGLISRYLDWPWVFWINIPLGALVLVMLFLMLAPSPRYPARIDYLGGGLMAASLCTLTLALSKIDPIGLPFVIYLSAAAVTFGLFLIRQRTTSDPLLPLGMFRALPFSSANVTHLLLGGALIIGMVTVPLMANTVLGLTALDGGLMLMRMTIAIPVGAVAGGYAAQRFGYRLPSVVGLLLIALGYGLMSGWGLDIADPGMTLHLATAGLGFGLLIAPIALAATNSVDVGLRGAASGVVTAMRIVGMTFGLAALTAWGVGRFGQLVIGLELPLPLPGETAEQSSARVVEFEQHLIDAGLSVFSDFFLIAMGIALAGVLAAAFMVQRRPAD